MKVKIKCARRKVIYRPHNSFLSYIDSTQNLEMSIFIKKKRKEKKEKKNLILGLLFLNPKHKK